MADDETIVIRVDSKQAEAALKALGDAGIQTGKDIESIGETTSGSTDKIAAFGAKLFGLTKIAGTFGEVIRQVANNVEFESDAAKEATQSTADLFTAIGSLDAPGVGAALGKIIGNLEAMRQGLDETTLAWGRMTDAASAQKFAGVLQAQRALVEGHKAEIAALDLKAQALSREIDSQQKTGEVSVFLKEKLQEYLDAYEKIHEAVPLILQEQAFELNVVSSATEKLGNVATEAHGKSAAAAKSHAESIAKVAEEQAKVIANAEKIIADIDAAAIRANQQEAADGSAGGAALGADAENLKKQIKALEDSPIISPDQQRNLDELKNSLLDNALAAKKLDQAFTVTADNFLTDAEAADKLNAELQIVAETQKFLTAEHDKAIASTVYNDKAAADLIDTYNELDALLGDTGSTFTDLGGEVDNLSGYAGAASDEFDNLGKSAEKGAKKADESLADLKAGAEEVLPILREIRIELQGIKADAAGIDL